MVQQGPKLEPKDPTSPYPGTKPSGLAGAGLSTMLPGLGTQSSDTRQKE